jgi:pimeloyl-ACP methyl ester carboxylesterase
MTMEDAAPAELADLAAPAAVLAAFDRRARRHETPCGAGSLVWRAWGEGPPVVLLHGADGAWSQWVRNIDALCAGRTVWAVDLPGFGDSALPSAADHPAIAQALADGLRRLLGPALPAPVVGFSFGGVVAAHLAALYPQQVIPALESADSPGDSQGCRIPNQCR